MADINSITTVGDFTNPYQQTYPDTCAIKSQQLIMNDFGIPVTEDQCVQYSIDNGWYSGDGTGTQCQDVGKLLTDSGIPCTQRENANVYDLANELAQGHKVIVGVDSGELWDGNILDWLKDIFMGNTPDHALIVAGIDMSDPKNPMVTFKDKNINFAPLKNKKIIRSVMLMEKQNFLAKPSAKIHFGLVTRKTSKKKHKK